MKEKGIEYFVSTLRSKYGHRTRGETERPGAWQQTDSGGGQAWDVYTIRFRREKAGPRAVESKYTIPWAPGGASRAEEGQFPPGTRREWKWPPGSQATCQGAAG